jgi:hypothetical protein
MATPPHFRNIRPYLGGQTRLCQSERPSKGRPSLDARTRREVAKDLYTAVSHAFLTHAQVQTPIPLRSFNAFPTTRAPGTRFLRKQRKRVVKQYIQSVSRPEILRNFRLTQTSSYALKIRLRIF